MDDSIIESLTRLGLSSYQARAYLTLVESGSMTAPDVAANGDLPQGRIYDVLNGLVDQSLVRADNDRPRTYAAVDPETATDRLLNQQLTDLQDRKQQLKTTATQLSTRLHERHRQTSDGDTFATSALGAEAAQELLLERLRAATETIRIVAEGVEVTPRFQDAFADLFLDQLQAGVSVELLISHFDPAVEQNQTLREAGLAVRRVDSLPHQRFILLDDTEVCLEVRHPLSSVDELLAVLNFRDVAIADELATGFATMWDAADRFPTDH